MSSGWFCAGGLVLILAGLGNGLVASCAAARYLAGRMQEFADFDPAAGALVSAILLTAGLLACLGSAWRAARIDPAVALRNE
jgi:ABC-type antimicrobial peptide transport system permease subunit